MAIKLVCSNCNLEWAFDYCNIPTDFRCNCGNELIRKNYIVGTYNPIIEE